MSKDAALGADRRRGDRAGTGRSTATIFEKDPRGFTARPQDVRPRVEVVRGRQQVATRATSYTPIAATRRRRRISATREPVQGVQDGQPRTLYDARGAEHRAVHRAWPRTRAEVAELYSLPPSVSRRPAPRANARRLPVGAQGRRGRGDARVGQPRHPRRPQEGRERPDPGASTAAGTTSSPPALADDLIKAQTGDERCRSSAFIPEAAPAAAHGGRARLHRNRDDAKQGRRGRAEGSRHRRLRGYLKVDPSRATSRPTSTSIRDLAEVPGLSRAS